MQRFFLEMIKRDPDYEIEYSSIVDMSKTLERGKDLENPFVKSTSLTGLVSTEVHCRRLSSTGIVPYRPDAVCQ